jgi:hypothetical protein
VKNEMKRGRSQVIWRYGPGATFRYNDSGAWCTTQKVTLRHADSLSAPLAQGLGAALRRWNAVGPTGYPDPATQPHKYAVGEPFQVFYTVWPLVFTCRRCGRVQFYQDLARLREVNDRLSCRVCRVSDVLRQVPYAYVHECGRLDTVFIPRHERTHNIQLVDKRSFQESYWYCKDCGTPLYGNPREGLGFRRCECAPSKGKRGVLLEDSRVFYSHTIDLVEIEPEALDRWKDNSRFGDLLLGAILRIPGYEATHLLDLAKKTTSAGTLSPELKAMRDVLVERGMGIAEAEALVAQTALKAGGDPWQGYDADLAAHKEVVGVRAWRDCRRVVEYVFVRDEPSAAAISLESLIEDARKLGDKAGVARLEGERALAGELGLVHLQIVEALPILLAGIGFSRYFASPVDVGDRDGGNKDAVTLRPYPEEDGKIPVYVARNTTEALLYELDPWRLAAFLRLNTGLTIPVHGIKTEQGLRAWLLSKCERLIEIGESHLVLRPFEADHGATVDEISALVFGVLHTVSHVLKATAHRYVGLDTDSLAEYLFPGTAAGLLYVSSHVQFTLGGIDSVFRSNLTQWLASARDYAGRCSFDPVCTRAGGACLACLYPKFGCSYFNRTLSRSFLFGGEVPGFPRSLIGFWSTDVTKATKALHEEGRGGVA